MLPSLDSLQLFLRAVQIGSLSRAADASHISLSAASRRISLLEHQFGTVLLDRLHDGVVPTPAGETLVRYIQNLMTQVESMCADLSDYACGAVGKIRLQANTSAISQNLPTQIARWAGSNPSIKIDLQEMRSNNIVEAIRNGDADVGVVTTDPVEDLRFECYSPDRLCAIVPLAHTLRAKSVAFVDLLAYDFVVLDDTANTTRAMKKEAHVLGVIPRILVQVQSFEAVCRLVAAELGIGILPKGALDMFKQSMKLRLIDLVDDWADRDMYVCVKKGQLPARIERFIDHLVSDGTLKRG